ncbi:MULTISPECIES: TetR/AcrR family transcriptional regulator [Actinoalloteichus]|uniref:TetR/AcrR family transcriptional regulator n=1 Tax=Actinoalloteichus TaxID=65496 RepID=UPI000953104F|nr:MULTISPECIES: TetR family transcriptional regulator C-terminal domain-containing protein [Actinoalloteichus]
MPKQVDHHQRRTLIADALMRVAAERGVEAVSLRHVAAEAGVTSGMVQHYFRSKDEMMTFAMEVIREKVAVRLTADAPGGDAPVTELVRRLLVQLLPLDEARRTEGRVALAFLAYAAGRPEIGAAVRTDNARLQLLVADHLRAAQAAGQVRADLEPAHAARALTALVEGLGMQALSGDCSPETALAVFDAQLDLLFGRSA